MTEMHIDKETEISELDEWERETREAERTARRGSDGEGPKTSLDGTSRA